VRLLSPRLVVNDMHHDDVEHQLFELVRNWHVAEQAAREYTARPARSCVRLRGFLIEQLHHVASDWQRRVVAGHVGHPQR